MATPSKAVFTKGPWHVEECQQCPERGRIYVHARGWLDPKELIAEACRTDRDVDNGDVAEAEANARLIAEAGTVAHETGLTPRQLAERCKELEAAAKALLMSEQVRDWDTPEAIAIRAAIAKTGGLSARTYHYDMAEPYTYTWPEGGTYYVMFNYFSFQNGKLNVGQCESVRQEDVPAVIAALEKNGRTRASYRYENGRAVLVTAAIAKTGGAA